MKKGFTLAEVLITLSILGVIAAISIPSIIQSYRKTQAISGLKIAYSLLNNVISLSEVNNGPMNQWEYYNCKPSCAAAQTKYLTKYIVPYLKIRKQCGNYPSSTELECFASENNKEKIQNINGTKIGSSETYSMSGFLLQNGMSLGFYLGTYNLLGIYIDINGPKRGHSRLGEDVFVFTIYPKHYNDSIEPGMIDWMYNSSTKSSNFTVEQLLSSNINSHANKFLCNKNAGNFAGAYCTTVIIKNGWKIPKDYPIKF